MPTMVRWSPLREFESFERRMRRMLDDAGIAPTSLPAADVYEEPTEFVVEVEVPGFDEDELTIEVTDQTIRVTGERREEKEETQKDYQLKERIESSFERQFLLPREADIEQLKAKYAKGVLELRAPKSADAEPRNVAIGKG